MADWGGSPTPEGLTSAGQECGGLGGAAGGWAKARGPGFLVAPPAAGPSTSADMGLRREGEPAKRGGAVLFTKVGQGSPGSLEARLPVGGDAL